MAGEELIAFLDTIDSELERHAQDGETLDIFLLGRAALILGYGVQLMTRDVDVVDISGSRLLEIAVSLFGKHGSRRTTLRFYLETVSSGLPPIPIGYQGRSVDLPGQWRVIRPKWPEAHDLIVTKLRRFHQGDREDVLILCDTGNVEAVTLRQRFELAHTFSDRDDLSVVSASRNLQAVIDYIEGRRKTI